MAGVGGAAAWRREFAGLIGESHSLRAAIEAAHRVAGHPGANVMLVGETGTGKELFARAIHYGSPSAGEPFVAINCSAIPETLLESELFGHEKGAFTDARTPKRGLLEVAGRGTVMLDEVNELPLNLQPKLLRVLEDRRVRRLGAVNEYDVSCRIIAATNRDLAACVEEGAFRTDLFYRLNVLRIELPTLRERIEDIEPLADHFVRMICNDHGLPAKRVSPDSVTVLRTHPWLGNVRELKNVLESAIVMCDGDTIRPEHIKLRKRASVPVPGDVIFAGTGGGAHTGPGPYPGTGTGGGAGLANDHPPHVNGRNQVEAGGDGTGVGTGAGTDGAIVLRIPSGGLTIDDVERALIRETLRIASGNRSLAARMLGVSRPTVLRKIQRYGLD
ncbi:MAG: sigma 54-interacting transcriptional regulator [Gemmatimonadetes bacterium]|nr:sigma 54-interacting transcriptional regulator [Gemmatimonadota bacterium]